MVEKPTIHYETNMRKTKFRPPRSSGENLLLRNLPFPSAALWLPAEVDVHGEHLAYRNTVKEHDQQRVTPTAETLRDFLGVASGSNRNILRVAERWGVLGICKHGISVGLHFQCSPLIRPGSNGDDWFHAVYLEPLETWRRLSRQAQALINAAARLHEGESIDDKDWRMLGAPRVSVRAESLDFQWRALVFEIGLWARIGFAVPLVSDIRQRPDIVLAYDGLYGAIAVQLLIACSGTHGLAICSHCRSAYLPSRRPNPNRRRYCDGCRATGAAVRDASRDYYAREMQKH